MVQISIPLHGEGPAPGAADVGPAGATVDRGAFVIGDNDFLLHGRPFRILSGALHYFRVHPDLWADRIRKARLMGLNTIETYVAWNAHAPVEGEFDLTGGLSLGRFLDLVAAAGMHAIVRPGPYICAEWDNGGLPAWLLGRPGCGVRRHEPVFMAAVREYLDRLLPVLVPRQVSHGGPIVLMQVENEYGAYGDDKDYLGALADLYRELGVVVPLTTVDQPTDEMLTAGSLPGLHKTGSFGSQSVERLEVLRRHQPTGPLMCAEFWNGWFDDWGTPHHVTPPRDSAAELDAVLRLGGSVNLYMFHGGTNFGLTNGANDKGTYEPITTSYDYDAPLDEAGNPTAKYWAFRDVIGRYAPVPDEVPEPAQPMQTLRVPFRAELALWDVVDRLGRWRRFDTPPTSDDLGHYHGFTLYRTTLVWSGPAVLRTGEVRDRAQVFLDGEPVGVLNRSEHQTSLTLPARARGTLELLVENQGRVDYGARLGEPKGLLGPVTLDGDVLGPWDVLPVVLDPDTIREALRDPSCTRDAVVGAPRFAEATFHLEKVSDLFLDTGDWGKGIAWINGFCLGRYWTLGPQRTLYVPGPVLHEGANELLVLELDKPGITLAAFLEGPDLGVPG